MAIGSAINAAERRKAEREKQAERIWKEQAARIEKEKRDADRRERQVQADRRRAEKEKQKAADRRKAETFKKDQARTDIEHYKIQRSELLKLYNEIEKQYSDAVTDSKKEISFRKMIALNNQIRGVDRQIEKAQYTINRTG